MKNTYSTWLLRWATRPLAALGLLLLVALALLRPLGASAQAIVSTLAGSDTFGFADGAGSTAQFRNPSGVAVDGAGNVYVADRFNHCIRKVSPAGVVTTLAGSGTSGFANGPGSTAQFSFPFGVAVDGAGNVYVADTDNNRIRKVSPAGVVTTLAGSGASGFADGAGSTAQFQTPTGVAVDGAGNVYVADQNNQRIRKVSPAGVVTTLAGSGTIGFADGASSTAQFRFPSGVAVDGAGSVYVADRVNDRIRKVSPAGVVTTLAGSNTSGFADGAGSAAQFYVPFGVAVDGAGSVYVADYNNQRIRKVSPAGVVTTLAGSGAIGFADGAGSAALFRNLTGVAVDGAGNVYVADQSNQRIRKVSLVAAPTLAAAFPRAAAVGQSITLTGNNLAGATAVRFNNLAQTTITNNSGTSLTVTVPTGAIGTVAVTVTTPGGTSNALSFEVLVVREPIVLTAEAEDITASSATLGGGVADDNAGTVTRQGVVYSATSTNATPAISGAGVTQVPGSLSSTGFFSTVTGLAPSTNYSVRAYATNSAGTSYGDVKRFTTLAPAPTLASLNPTSAPAGSSVTLTGSNLSGATAVTFAGTSNNTVTTGLTVGGLGSSQTLTVIVPTGATSGNVTVTTPGGTSSGVAFTVITLPTVATGTPSIVSTTDVILSLNSGNSGGTVAEFGVVYVAGTGTPTLADTKLLFATANNSSFNGAKFVTGLTPGTTYTVRAYATNSAGTSYGSAVRFTTLAAPTTVVSLNRAGSSPTNAGNVSYTVTFAAPVTGLSTSNFALVPTGSVAGASLTSVSGSGTTYTVTANTGTGDGTLGLNLANATGLSPSVSNVPFTGQVYTIDKTSPTATFTSMPFSGTNSPNVTFTFTGKDGTGSGVASFQISINGGSYVTANSPLTLSGLSDGIYTVRVRAIDNASNVGNPASYTFTVDTTRPTPTVSTTSPSSTSAATIPFTVTFSEPVTGFSASSLNVSNGTITGGTVSGSGSGPYTFSVTPIFNGLVSVSVFAGVVRDDVGNANIASNTVSVQYSAPVAASLSVLYQTGDLGQPTDGQVRPFFQLVNSGTSAVPYQGLTIRYWLTAENFMGQLVTPIDYAKLGTSFVSARYVPLATPRQGALGYIEYSFAAGAGSLNPGTDSGPIYGKAYKSDYSSLDETDDWSYQTSGSFTPNDHVTLYQNGTLLAGTEPAEVTATTALQVLTASRDASASPQYVSVQLQVRNTGNVPVNYGDVRVRYYFTRNGNQEVLPELDYAQLGNNNVSLRVVNLPAAVNGADAYLEVRFAAGLGTFYPRSSTGDILLKLRKEDYSAFDQTDDYSFSSSTALALNPRVTALVSNRLVFGSAPTGAPARMAGSSQPATAAMGGATIVAAASGPLALTASPNPFGEQLTLRFALPTAQAYTLAVYDGQGRLVQQLASGQAEAEQAQEIAVPTQGYAAGLYLVHLATAQGVQTLKLVKR